jgi:hypothetical protein
MFSHPKCNSVYLDTKSGQKEVSKIVPSSVKG